MVCQLPPPGLRGWSVSMPPLGRRSSGPLTRGASFGRLHRRLSSNRHHMHRLTLLVLGALVVVWANLRASDVVISEFMALNGGSLRDADGDASDWIEIHNGGATLVSLDGWFLTDDPAN